MAEKGKVKDIQDGTGGIVTDKKGIDYSFTQPNHKALCLNIGDEVKFDLITLKEGSPQVALNVQRLTAGTILSVDGVGNGELEETKTLKKVKFFHPHPAATGIKAGDDVKYDLINTSTGDLAVNLEGVGE